MNKIGQKLKSLRQQNNYRQDSVAKQLGCSVATYCKIETGSIQVTFKRLQKVSEFYGLKMYELLLCEEEGYANLNQMIDLQEKRINMLRNEIIDIQRKVIQLHQEIHSL